MTYDEMKTALECHAQKKYCCEECPIKTDDDCSIDLAKKVLEVLNAKDELLDKRQMALETVNLALDKGGYSVTVRHGTWDRKSCVNGKQYDPTTDYWAYAHRCSECDKVSYFPNDIPDKWCRHCGAKMDGDGDADGC